jgi:hypothetical protein
VNFGSGRTAGGASLEDKGHWECVLGDCILAWFLPIVLLSVPAPYEENSLLLHMLLLFPESTVKDYKWKYRTLSVKINNK